jgi:hypothetical protein
MATAKKFRQLLEERKGTATVWIVADMMQYDRGVIAAGLAEQCRAISENLEGYPIAAYRATAEVIDKLERKEQAK